MVCTFSPSTRQARQAGLQWQPELSHRETCLKTKQQKNPKTEENYTLPDLSQSAGLVPVRNKAKSVFIMFQSYLYFKKKSYKIN